ncbi:uncharacterized protein N7446_009593 [Penicillium canescens]|uniref:Pheromone receptor n=1 Tax=Penicillium canescens TaxID=5083 RepID=A0AAD6N697_PENCN|nr:uncharacterized protein N7446_009593 [Penicillium canescens]KAJ6034838.1 hypothetical protein N7460_009013 [Penicillium canescens]KAJ6046502.1 hypothetical protein N7444_007756 [Penicillium canescens]KAJ6053581.1 hypothetical protein N7446_009593 [Penicillium canescens]
MDPTKRHPLAVGLPILSFFSITLGIPPLLLHAKNRNFPATSLVSWSILLNLFNIINALTWPNDDVDSWWDGAGLCDIELKFMVAGYVGVPGSLMCIFRSLAIVLDTDRATLVPSKGQRWRNRFMDMLFCVVVPVIAMITHIVWQKSRYLLYSISGCVNDFDESWVSLVLAFIWPPVICLAAAYYCCLVLLRIHKYRSDFASIVRASSSNLSKSRFLRLFFLALSMLICILPLQAYVVYADIHLSFPWHPYSWNRIHNGNWSTINKVATYGVVFFDRWTPVASGFMIFIFFGFGRDAARMYRTTCWYLGLGYCFPSITAPADSNATPLHPHTNGHVSTSTTLVETISSKARSFFSRPKSRNMHQHQREHQQHMGVFNSTRATYNDLEKGGAQPSHLTSAHSTCSTHEPAKKTFCDKFPFSLFRRQSARHESDATLLDDLSVPSHSRTVLTNAWAGSSRGSRDYSAGPSSASSPPPHQQSYIHVKKVISQQSEIQV